MTATLPTSPDATTFRPEWVTQAKLASWTRWVVRSGEETTISIAPYDAQPTAPVPCSTAADVTTAVDRARAAQRAWGDLTFRSRAEVVLRFHDLLVERQDEVMDLIQWEMGKARFNAWQEILQVANIARHYATHGAKYLADRQVRGAVPVLTRVKEVRVPVGVVGIISPWNYPLYLGVGDLIPALLAGNCVVGKADPHTPLTLLWARALMAEAGLPEPVWQVVTGPGEILGSALVDHVDYVCFTGSTRTGRKVAERAATRLVGASLELGGKNPMIVRADADVERAATGAVDAVFANTGQMCIHLERLIVHTTVYEEFKEALLAATSGQRLGQAYDFSCDIGSLASRDQLDKVTAHVDDAVAKGATVLAGGRARPEVGPFVFAPTVLEDVTADMDLCLGETFGPVVALYRAADDEEALALANQGSYGLSASIFSKDTAGAEQLARRLRAGSVNINDGASLAAGSIEAGMGGMGQSGLGRRHGAEGIRKYTEQQTLATSRLGPLGSPAGSSLEKFVALGNKQLGVLRRLRVR